MNFFRSYIAEHPAQQAAYVELYNCYNDETAADLINFFNLLPPQALREHKLLLSYMLLKRGNINMAKKVNNSIIISHPNSLLSTRAKMNNFYIALYNENDFDGTVTIFNDILARPELVDTLELQLLQNALESYAQMHGIEFGGRTLAKGNPEKIVKSEIPDKYILLGNYPNPFNPSTTISYALPYQSKVELIIYDILGREVKIFSILQESGYKNILWDGKNENGNFVSSGIYLYRLNIKSLENNETYVKTAKLMMLK